MQQPQNWAIFARGPSNLDCACYNCNSRWFQNITFTVLQNITFTLFTQKIQKTLKTKYTQNAQNTQNTQNTKNTQTTQNTENTENTQTNFLKLNSVAKTEFSD